MDLAARRARIRDAALDYAPHFFELCDALYRHPEPSEQEHFACALLTQKIAAHGFTVETPAAGLPTAFSAARGTGTRRVAFAAEYDALPGYGSENREYAHACGHNWIAAASYAAAVLTAEAAQDLPATVVLLGTPAEETVGNKVDMIQAGCFDHLDALFQMHLSGQRTALFPRSLAMDAIEFTFIGRAAHAANAPQEGVNALEACNLTFAGINALRQHIDPDARIHGIICEGGVAPNIVPARGVCRFYVRAATRAQCDTLTGRVLDCARGAALMTGAQLSYRFFEHHIDDLTNDPKLAACMQEHLLALGETDIFTGRPAPFGSSDIGNVSHVCPTLYVCLFAGNTDGSDIHEEAFLQHVNSPAAHEKLLLAAQAMALTALDVLTLDL